MVDFSYFTVRKFHSIKVKFVNILFGLAIVMTDFIVYGVIGIALMEYEDNYDVSKGEMWSWKSMTTFDRIAFTSLYAWHALNIIFLGWAVLKLYRIFKTKYTTNI